MLPLRDENPVSRPTYVTWGLILLGAVVFVLGQFGGSGVSVIDGPDGRYRVEEHLLFNLEWASIPCELQQGRPLTVTEIEATYNGADPKACDPEAAGPSLFPGKWVFGSLVVSLFLHANVVHLGVNLLFLWIFGNNIEDRIGHVAFLAFYLLAGIFATLGHALAGPSSTIPVVGASGAIAGIMGAYLAWFPDAPIRTLVFLIVVDIRSRWFLGLWFATQFFTGAESATAWVAHVVGFVFGFLLAMIFRGLFPDPTGGAGRGPYPHPTDWIP